MPDDRDDRDDRSPPRRNRPRRDNEYDDDEYDDDRPRRRGRREPEYDPALRMVVPLNTSALAIIAGYLGLISVLCLPAPFALLMGVLALGHLRRNPKLDGKVRAIFAIVMGAVFTIPLLLLLLSLVARGVK